MSTLGNSSDSHLASGAMVSSSPPVDSVLSAITAVLPAVSTWTLIGSTLLAIVIYDQIKYQLNKKGIAGPRFKIPIMGAFLDSLNPTFDGYLKKWESGPLSCVSVFHKFVVIAPTRDLARRIFNSPNYVQPCVVDAGKKILKHTNWVFLDGKAHVDYRKGLNGLFTRKAVGAYIAGQEEVYDESFEEWVAASEEAGKHIPFFSYFREINVAVSCRTFCGKYISKEAVHEISRNYWRITAAMELVNFPIVLPFTKIWYGIQARKVVLREFEACAAKSRVRMRNKESITCMMDAWIRGMIDAQEYAALPAERKEGSDEPAPILIRDFSDSEIAQTFLSFLFASQDATSSATIWLFQYMADNPEVLAKVREEQLAVRDGDRNKRLDYDMAEKMEYTRWCVKESLRMRPPVLMVPYQAKKDFPITPGYTVPKGSMVIPTLWHSLHDESVYPEPYKFNPLRWGPDGIAEQNHKNWLVFGCGPHVCLGQNYAIMHLGMCLGKASLFLDWDHKVTNVSDDIRIFATIFPQDDCLLTFKRRE